MIYKIRLRIADYSYKIRKRNSENIMIFITLGSQKFQFNRLLVAMDKLVESSEIDDEVFAQIGYSNYLPKHYRYKKFLNRDEFLTMEAVADIVITHGGTGAIVGAIKKGKKVIAVPRLTRYGEHVDDHQLQIISEFSEKNLICGIEDCSEIKDAIAFVNEHKFDVYRSNTDKIIESIERFILQ